MFELYLQALRHGSPDNVLEDRFQEDLLNIYSETCLFDMPDSIPATIVDTDWYKFGTGCVECRKADYPPMAEYLDGIAKGDDQQIAKYKEDCLATKARFPKPF
ncbi:hypothetical protein [Maridesulfovibrio ferrireducens]|uniref:hypothetical protein n=1 Tax=Maridesulfovibrio ferrireducens TaxID=246191 RepID=UPI001A2BA3FC|nr:hypothetical protein [Maridesulfovibrio ferrireducens]MBI9113171.1 hypothetical protein [Maridesulfovibrio ferrireducens]